VLRNTLAHATASAVLVARSIGRYVTPSAEQSEPYELGVSIADADAITFAYDGDTLLLNFTDWQGLPRAVRFSDTAAFKWQRAEEERSGERDDEAYAVNGSAWLAFHRHENEATPKHRHPEAQLQRGRNLGGHLPRFDAPRLDA
jgi:hypothetical protein